MRSVGIWASQLDSSSVRPSQNDWSDFASVISMNGNTTIELADAAVSLSVEDLFQISAPASITARISAPPKSNGNLFGLRGGGLKTGTGTSAEGVIAPCDSNRLPGAISR